MSISKSKSKSNEKKLKKHKKKLKKAKKNAAMGKQGWGGPNAVHEKSELEAELKHMPRGSAKRPL